MKQNLLRLSTLILSLACTLNSHAGTPTIGQPAQTDAAAPAPGELT